MSPNLTTPVSNGTATTSEHQGAKSDHEWVDTRRERRLRRAATRQGLILSKSRRRDPHAHDFGAYWLFDLWTNVLVCSHYGLTLDEVEAQLGRGL